MGPDGIFQFEQPLFLPDSSPAQINRRFDAHVLDLFPADDLLNIDPEQLVLFVLKPDPQWPDLPGSTAHGYHIHGINLLLHIFAAFLIFIYYSTFVRI